MSHAQLFRGRFFVPLFLLMIALAVTPAMAQTLPPATDAQVFYVPVYEDEVKTTLDVLEGSGAPDIVSVESVVSIAIWGNDTVVYYDHFEDGYEAVLSSPIQSTTEVWGDGDADNGIWPGAAGSSDADDVLSSGDVITLRDTVDVISPPATWFGGGDKIGASRPVAVTRIAWDLGAGPLLAGAVEVYETREWGTEFYSPVGPTAGNSFSMFEHTWLVVMAGEDGTEVEIDEVLVAVLDEGESYLHANPTTGAGLSGVGTKVTASSPVQVHLITGDAYPSGFWESRWYTMTPFSSWGSDYYSPIGTLFPQVTDPVAIWAYNPDPDNSIYVKVDSDLGDGGADDCFEVPAGQVARYDLPAAGYSGTPAIGLGAHLFTDGQNCGDLSSETSVVGAAAFAAVATVNATPDDDNDTWDWGFWLPSIDRLTTQALVGWGPGNDAEPPSANGNPVWVTPVADTTVYYIANGVEQSLALQAFESAKLYDVDNDQTGMKVYTKTDVPLAVVWGEDPETAGGGAGFLDVGTTVVPVADYTVRKDVELLEDVDGSGGPTPGDVLLYTIFVINEKQGTLEHPLVADELPAGTLYEADSTRYRLIHGDGTEAGPFGIDDDAAPDSAFPLDEDGHVFGSLNVFEDRYIVQFEVQIDPALDPSIIELVNNVCVEPTNSEVKCDDIDLLVPQPGIALAKTVYVGHDDGAGCAAAADMVVAPQDANITYCFTVTNTGNTWLDELSLCDEALGMKLGELSIDGSECGGTIAPEPDPGPMGPLAPGAERAYYFETQFTTSLADALDNGINTAGVTGNPTDEGGSDIPGIDDNPWDDDTAEIVTEAAEIQIVKFTNGDDANEPTGPFVPVGGDVTWTYRVTNTGNVALNLVVVTDSDPTVTPDCGEIPDPFEPLDTFTCTASGTAEAGQYSNIGTAVGQLGDGGQVSDTDLSHYFGAEPSIDLVKTGTFQDESGDGFAQVGETIGYSFTVTNTGNVTLTNVTLSDTVGGVTISGGPIASLAPGAVDNTTFTGSYALTQADIEAGSFFNTATVAGECTAEGCPVTDPDDHTEPLPQNPSIALDKVTRDSSGNAGDEIPVQQGEPVTWVYTVTNDGNVTLTGIALTDNPEGDISCPMTMLAVGESMTCEAYGTAIGDRYDNLGTVTGYGPQGTEVVASDPSSYLGAPIQQTTIVELTKLVSGIEDGADYAFDFEIRSALGAPIVGDTVTPENNPTTFFNTPFGPGEYLLCELGVSPSWNSSLLDDPTAFHPEVDGVLDWSTVCVTFEIVEVTTEPFAILVTNDSAADPRTIGYWGNHCSLEPEDNKGNGGKGNSDKVYIQTLEGMVFLDGYDGYQLVVGELADCGAFVNLLDKRDLDGKKQASDPIFNMVAQLIAAQLNVLNSGSQCVGVSAGIDDAITLLGLVAFDGFGYDEEAYAGLFGESELDPVEFTNLLADYLDLFNNSEFGAICGLYVEQLDEDGTPIAEQGEDTP